MGGGKVAEGMGPALDLSTLLGEKTHWDVTIGNSVKKKSIVKLHNKAKE